MDELLARIGVQTLNFALRSGIALTSRYAIGQYVRLVKTIDNKALQTEFKVLQERLNSRIQIISPAIDLIELKSGRGSTSLAAALPLARSLHRDIIALGKQFAAVASDAEDEQCEPRKRSSLCNASLQEIISETKSLLDRIDREIPILQLAISTSGETLSTALPASVSPSRLLQASMFLNIGDTQFACGSDKVVQIGPSFALSLYMLFAGHAHDARTLDVQSYPGEEARLGDARISVDTKHRQENGTADYKPIWQETLHKARVRICRIPLGWTFDPKAGYQPNPSQSTHTSGSTLGSADHFVYHLEIVENLDDDRVHDHAGEPPSSYLGIRQAGLRASVPIHQFSKILYANTGRLLNIGGDSDADSNPVLLLKREPRAVHPLQMNEAESWDEYNLLAESKVDAGHTLARDQQEIDRQLHDESWMDEKYAMWPAPGSSGLDLPAHLDPEWMAFEVYTCEDDSDSSASEDEDARAPSSLPSPRSSIDQELIDQIRNISVHDRSATIGDLGDRRIAKSPMGSVPSSLSLMETLIRLTSLQEFQQAPHLTIPDHVLTFFLEQSSTTGLRGEEKWKARHEAKRRVGFDPYTDSPS